MKRLSLLIISILVIMGASVTYAFAPQYGLNDGLVGYWPLDTRHNVWTSATAGTTVDMSGNGYTGVFTSLVRATSPVLGKMNEGMSFDGSADLITTPYVLSNSQPFTVSFWAYFNNVDTGAQALFSQDSTGTDDIGVPYSPSTGLGWESETDAHSLDQITYFHSGQISTGWHHITIVEKYTTDVDNNDYYIDGVEVPPDQSGSGATNPANTTLVIGNRGAGNIGFDGIIDDFRIYNRTLSDNEIKQLYRLGLSGYGR